MTTEKMLQEIQEISDFKMLEEIIDEWLSKKELAIKIYELWWTRRTRVSLIPWLVWSIIMLFISFLFF